MNNTSRIEVFAAAEAGRRVKEHNGLSNSTRSGEDHESVGDWLPAHVVKYLGTETKVVNEAVAQQSM